MITGKIYLQNYVIPDNKFVELDSNISGISLLNQPRNYYQKEPFRKESFTGLYIPSFATQQIFTYPVKIGQRNLIDCPGIVLGKYNLAISPEIVRYSGSFGEIIIGELNSSISGVSNSIIGLNNVSFRTFGAYVHGIDNTIKNSFYNTTVGSANYVSGIYASNVFGKGNVVFADYLDDVEGNAKIQPVKVHSFSGYYSTNNSIFGDNNYLFSGGSNIVSLGHYNTLEASINLTNAGSLNNIYKVSGDNNLVVGHRNDLTESQDANLIGLENQNINTSRDFTVGLYNLNEFSSRNFIFGENNRIYSGFQNLIVGNLNDLKSNFDFVIGKGNVSNINTSDNLVFGKLNTLSGANNNLIIGEANRLDKNYITDAYFLPEGINTDSYNNIFLGNSNKGFVTNSTDIFGSSNRTIANTESKIIGNSNISIENDRGVILGSNNSVSGTVKNYTFGFDNYISNITSGIFIGFNFTRQNGNISGIGISITPTGINLYGALTVNGVRMNVP